MNVVVLLGRLTKDPETKTTNNDVTITRYTLAVDRRGKQENGPQADFINCLAFNKAAEFANKYFRKGQRVCVSGRIQTRNWEDNDGNKHYATEVLVNEQNFADGKKDGNGGGWTSVGDQQQPPAEYRQEKLGGQAFYPIDEGVEDDDLPF